MSEKKDNNNNETTPSETGEQAGRDNIFELYYTLKEGNLLHDLYHKGLPHAWSVDVPATTKYMFLVYPFHTLATNRIISTVISRKLKRKTMVHDLIDMW